MVFYPISTFPNRKVKSGVRKIEEVELANPFGYYRPGNILEDSLHRGHGETGRMANRGVDVTPKT